MAKIDNFNFKARRTNNDDVFIIGGAPSLLELIPDTSILDDKNIINCNNAYDLFPDALITHFADGRWWKWNSIHFMENYKGIKTNVYVGKRSPIIIDESVFRFIRGSETGLTDCKRTLNGISAGHQAINLAFHMGFKNVYLCGFDMNPQTLKTSNNWHNKHKTRPDYVRNIYSNHMIPSMESIANQMQNTDFKIYNINPDSYLKCFPYIDIKEII